MSARVDARERELLQQTRAFAVGARSSDDVWGAWQFGSTLIVVAAVTLGMRALDAFAVLLMPVWALVAVRVFVLQHDCGHRSLFTSKAVNDVVGRVLAVVTDVAHDG